ncbi:hypothetical protein QAD02_001687 [Eretmocerus hayati]|uniref:Uncharacterized protein n=1 Tax=Eretmocerus hayati TaxID=131215 RepID=A0ACC2NHZ0_9HYME|nr:hypothetical protein QAD02_001687 [Eretmocerus hayati]
MNRLTIESNLHRSSRAGGFDSLSLCDTSTLPRRLFTSDVDLGLSPRFKNGMNHATFRGFAPIDRHQLRNFPLAGSNPSSIGDRFIPRRRGLNVDFYHMRKNRKSQKVGPFLDVFEEIKNATERWRSQHMTKLFESTNAFDVLKTQRVLNITEPRVELNAKKVPTTINNYLWKCKPRKQPLMSMKGESSKRYRDHGAQIFRFAVPIKLKNLIDWSSKNVLVAGMSHTMCICDVDFKSLSKVYRIDHQSSICCLKWNPEGTRVAISDVDGITCLYDVDSMDYVWNRKCSCYGSSHIEQCRIMSKNWLQKHKHLVTVCTNGRLNIMEPSNGEIISEHLFKKEIYEISFSPTEEYLAVSESGELVKLYEYPAMHPMFEIEFFAEVKAMAWHPWSTGILCIGGGPGDGSLSLWNVNSQRHLCYRKITFLGSVDSMMFNKLSGELVVHWYYLDGNRLRSVIAVLADFDTIVDAVPLHTEHRMLNIIWNHDHSKLAMQHRDMLLVWNFFGNDDTKWIKVPENKRGGTNQDRLRNYFAETCAVPEPCSTSISTRRAENFSYYNIR